MIGPHDLLEPVRSDRVRCEAAPDWVARALAEAPLVVVRRAPAAAGLPVGIRGDGRNQRCAGWLAPGDVLRRIRPEDLSARRAWREAARAARFPHFAAMERIDAWMRAAGLVWGPVGGAGFELASGRACLNAASDLDLIIRTGPAPRPDAARELLARFQGLPVRVDALLETPLGGVALAEFAAGPPRIALRTPDGPRLVANPWP
jgi:phosphoribosyl-dephospho-CoA transferase